MATQCYECGVYEGELHKLGCENEICPFCGLGMGVEYDGCRCMYEQTSELWDHDIHTLITNFNFDEMELLQLRDKLDIIRAERRKQIIKDTNRIPFIDYPSICARCGKIDPDMFMVSNRDWEKYIEPSKRHKELCRECYDEIKTLIDKNNTSIKGNNTRRRLYGLRLLKELLHNARGMLELSAEKNVK